jgi:hypothetical protein
LADGIDYSWITPELAKNPSVAAGVAKTPNPTATSLIASHAINGVSASDIIAEHQATNDSTSFWSKAGLDVFKGLNFLAKPLQEVQKDYKFVHSVYQKHGFLDGFVATAGTVLGGLAGSVLGPEGTVLGAGLGSALTRRIMGSSYKDSLADSENANYKISPGRDFSNLLSNVSDSLGAKGVAAELKNTNAGLGKFVSGIGDAGFDVTADPVSALGKFNQVMKAGKYLNVKDGEIVAQAANPIMKAVPGIQDFLAARSARVFTPQQLDAVRDSSGITNAVSRTYNRALDDMENINKTAATPAQAAGIIAQKYPELGTVAPARIAQLKDADEIHDFMRNSVYFGELSGTLAGSAILPSRTLMRATTLEPLQKVLRGDANPDEMNWVRKGYKTFSGYMPYSVDNTTGELSTKTFKWDNPDAAGVIYKIARFGGNHSWGTEMAGQYAQAVATNDLGLARAIKAQTTFDAFKAMGLPDDNVLMMNAKTELEKLGQPTVGQSVYGSDVYGNPIGTYETTGGKVAKAGVSEHQFTDEFSIPDFNAAKAAMRSAGKLGKYYGPFDTFISKAYTNSIFKPLALATMGFGLRVAGAELIPAVARYGVTNLIKAKLAASAAKTDALLPGEGGNVASAALVALGAHAGISPDVLQEGFPAFKSALAKGLAKVSPSEQLEHAIDLVRANDGHILQEAVSTGGGGSASTRYDMADAAHTFFQQEKRKYQYRELPEYTTYQADSPHFLPSYATSLTKEAKIAKGKNIANDIVDVLGNTKKISLEPEFGNNKFDQFQTAREELINREYQRIMDTKAGNYQPYKREAVSGQRWKDQDPRQFAADRVDSVLGLTVGKDGTVHTPIAQAIANGESPDFKYLKNIGPRQLPATIPGNQVEAYIPSGPTPQSIINHFVDLGFNKLIDPVINNLSREPLYLIHFSNEMKSLKYLEDTEALTHDQAIRIAQYRAVHAMLPQIHNTALRTQFSQLARNFMPFYFAQEQSVKRAFRVAKDTGMAGGLLSNAVRKYQMAEQVMNNPSFVSTDSNGNSYAYLPMVGEFGKGIQKFINAVPHFGNNMVVGLPISAQGSMTSLKSVIPGLDLPGFGPIAAIPSSIVADWFPHLAPTINGALGLSASRGVWESFLPSKPILNVWNALGPDQQNSAMTNALFGALSSAYMHQDELRAQGVQIPTDASTSAEKEAFIDRIRNNAKSILILKAITGMLSPLSPRVEQVDVGLRDEFTKLVKSTGNYNDALLKFLQEHGDKAISYTISTTTPSTRGATFPYTQKAIDEIESMRRSGLMSNPKTSSAAAFLIPEDPGPGNTLAIHQQLIREHLRENRTPLEFLNQFYISQGNNYIAPLIAQHTANVNQYKQEGNTYALQMENQQWSDTLAKMKTLQPTWYENYSNGAGRDNAAVIVSQLQTIFSDPKLTPKTEQAKLVQGLLSDWQSHMNTINQYKQLKVTGEPVSMENQNWQTYLENLKTSEPRLTSVINAVFSKVG